MTRTTGKRSSQGPSSSMIESRDGLLHLGQSRAMLMTESAFAFLQQVISEQMPEFMAFGFYEMGFRAGADLAASIDGKGRSPEAAFRALVERYKEGGYGDVEVVEFDLSVPRATLRGTRLLESSAARRSGIHRSPRAVDHYSRGIFAGLFSSLHGQEVVCEELACEFRGDPHCEFSVLAFGGKLGG